MIKVACSIVLYRHSPNQILPLVEALLGSHFVKNVVLVDNGDCDWASDLANERIAYIRPLKNVGYGAGHNLAIQRCARHVDYYLICNPDIRIESDALDTLIREMEISGFAFVMPDIRNPDGSRQNLCKLLPSPWDLVRRRFFSALIRSGESEYSLEKLDFSKSCFVPSLSGCFMLFKSIALIQLGGFDERYFLYMEDVDLSRRAAATFGAFYLPSAKVTHFFAKGSYKRFSLLKLHIVSAVKYFNKWGWFFDKERRTLNEIALRQIRGVKSVDSRAEF